MRVLENGCSSTGPAASCAILSRGSSFRSGFPLGRCCCFLIILLGAVSLSLGREVGGINVGRVLKFDSGFLQLVLIAQELAFADVFGGRVKAHAREAVKYFASLGFRREPRCRL